MGEFDIIERFFRREHLNNAASLAVPNGDDAAVFDLPGAESTCISVDSYLPGVHFPEQAGAARVARRTLACALSDLAAMGATPYYFTLALTIPEVDEEWLADFSRGLYECASQWELNLIGGDTTRGPLSISYQVLGGVSRGQAMARSGAQTGDLVCLSGPTGLANAALERFILEPDQNPSNDEERKVCDYYWLPEPKFQLGHFLSQYANSCIDISDGLMAELVHLATSSCKQFSINVDNIPITESLRELAQGKCLEWAMTGGDDYELVFTVPKHFMPRVRAQYPHLHVIGEVLGDLDLTTDSQAVSYRSVSGHDLEFTNRSKGFLHFD